MTPDNMPSFPLPPGRIIGILGGGQLGRMLALAAAQLGFKTHIYCPEHDAPAFDVTPLHTVAAYDNFQALAQFAQAVDVVTYEFENVPAQTAAAVSQLVMLSPCARALDICQDRIAEKTFAQSLGLQTARFAAVDDLTSLQTALETVGLPAILKTRRLGYDGKGQVKINSPAEADAAFATLKAQPCILEALVPFSKEISVLVARNANGQTAVYPPIENTHRHHILHTSICPAAIDKPLQKEAEDIALKLAAALDYVGVLAVELFLVEGHPGTLFINELAPRVHNSGHLTMSACVVGQFEQHIRAVCGWPLGNPRLHSPAVMTNIIGDDCLRWLEFASADHTALHHYGKAAARPGRKMGHITRLDLPDSGF